MARFFYTAKRLNTNKICCD